MAKMYVHTADGTTEVWTILDDSTSEQPPNTNNTTA